MIRVGCKIVILGLTGFLSIPNSIAQESIYFTPKANFFKSQTPTLKISKCLDNSLECIFPITGSFFYPTNLLYNDMQITNPSSFTAYNICAVSVPSSWAGHVFIDCSACTALPPGNSCVLQFVYDNTIGSSSTPETIIIQGSNTTPSPVQSVLVFNRGLT